jgi:hypothetical protein
MTSGQHSYSTVHRGQSIDRINAQQGATISRYFELPDSSDRRVTISHDHIQGDISSESTRQNQQGASAHQPRVTFGNVVIEGGDEMGTVFVGEQAVFRGGGDVLSSEMDREVLNTILETGTDEKGRRALKARYAKLSPLGRRQREIRLAQYSGFAMRSDGTLDYGIDTPKKTNFIKKLFHRFL